MSIWDNIKNAASSAAQSVADAYTSTTTFLGETGYKGYSFFKHMANYDKIIVDPHAKLTADERGMDAVGPVTGYRNIAASGLAPMHPNNPVPTPTPPTPAMRTVISDTLVDMVLVNTLSQLKAPKAILEKFGKDKVDFIADKKGDPQIIAINDPAAGKIRAFQLLAIERDVDPNKPDATGLCAVAFAEIKVDAKYQTPTEFINDTQNKHEFTKVRMEWQGYQANFVGSAAPGQLDRGGVPNQLTGVLAFNKRVNAAMTAKGMPKDAEVSTTSHSLGNAPAMLSSYMWENHPDLNGRTQGPVTTVEPIGAAIAARQIATLSTALEQAAGRKTDIETELQKLIQKITVIQNSGESPIRAFQIDDSAANGLAVGARVYDLNMPSGFAAHTATSVVNSIYENIKQRKPILFVSEESLPSAAQIADKKGDDLPKNFFSRSVNYLGHAFLSVQQSFGSHPDGQVVRTDPTVTLLKQMGEAKHVPETTVRQLVNIALGIGQNPNASLPVVPVQNRQTAR